MGWSGDSDWSTWLVNFPADCELNTRGSTYDWVLDDDNCGTSGSSGEHVRTQLDTILSTTYNRSVSTTCDIGEHVRDSNSGYVFVTDDGHSEELDVSGSGTDHGLTFTWSLVLEYYTTSTFQSHVRLSGSVKVSGSPEFIGDRTYRIWMCFQMQRNSGGTVHSYAWPVDFTVSSSGTPTVVVDPEVLELNGDGTHGEMGAELSPSVYGMSVSWGYFSIADGNVAYIGEYDPGICDIFWKAMGSTTATVNVTVGGTRYTGTGEVHCNDLATLTFDLNYGSGSSSTFADKTEWGCSGSASFSIPSTSPTRSGYNFSGWKGSDGKSYSASGTVSVAYGDTVELTAQWTAIVQVSSISLSTTSTSVYVGSSITITATTSPPTADNRHVSWTLSSGYSTYVSRSTSTTSTGGTITLTGKAIGTVTLYATASDGYGATSSTCTVRVHDYAYLYFDANTADAVSGMPSTQTGNNYTSTTSITIPDDVPTRSGYTFVEWNTNSGGTGTSYKPGGTISVSTGGSTTLYAVWEEAPVVVPLYVRHGAEWKAASEVWTSDGAEWREASDVRVHDGAGWRRGWKIFHPHMYQAGVHDAWAVRPDVLTAT